jgi:hypothetical protein
MMQKDSVKAHTLYYTLFPCNLSFKMLEYKHNEGDSLEPTHLAKLLAIVARMQGIGVTLLYVYAGNS